MRAMLMCLALASAPLFVGSALAEPVQWSVDPELIPWETLATVIDGKRKQARSLKEIERRRRALLRSLDGIREPREAVESMVEMGDLYRDEARLVLVGEFDQEERLVLRTSPAWLQLEAALEWYQRAREAGPGVAEGLDRGRLALVEAVTLTRLGRSREAFAAYANIVRSYRRTRYADFALLALGDHHVRTGNEVKGRRAYGVVAGSRDRDLDVYARFRLAHLDALAGDEESATEGLEKLVGEAPGSPLQAMVRRGVLTALAVHRSEELSLTELVDWMEERCRSEHPSCVRELRAASADQLSEVARDRAASWLRNVDRLSFLAGRFETRRQVATYASRDADAWRILATLTEACDGGEDCWAAAAVGLRNYYDDLGRPEFYWMQDFLALPKVMGESAVNLEIGRLSQENLGAVETLERVEGQCSEAASCRAEARQAVAAMFRYQWRNDDAAWVTSLDRPPVMPDRPGMDVAFAAMNRERVGGRKLLDALEPLCEGESACAGFLRVTLAKHLENTGNMRDAVWLRGLGKVPQTGNAKVDEALRAAARRDLGARRALDHVSEACPPADDPCQELVLGALRTYFAANADHRAAAWLDTVPRTTAHPADRTLRSVVRRALSPVEALDALPLECALEPVCSRRYRANLLHYYQQDGDLEAARWLGLLGELPIVPRRPLMNVLLGEILEADLAADEALLRIRARCGPDVACVSETATVLGNFWVESGAASRGTSLIDAALGAD